MLNFIEVKDERLLDVLNKLVITIWNEYYKPIFGDFKVRYMLEAIHNKATMKREIESGYKYYILQKDDQHIGYISFANIDHFNKRNVESVLIHKFYIAKAFRFQGLSRLVLDFIIAHNTSATNMWLMVNKNDTNTIAIFKELGFSIQSSHKKDMGKGYIVEEVMLSKQLEVAKISTGID